LGLVALEDLSLSANHTYIAKLTLSVDDRVILNAKRYPKQRGVSVSKIVETYLSAIADPPPAGAGRTPVLNSVRGILRKADIDEYRKHLAAKY
jgi:hypothetical protein